MSQILNMSEHTTDEELHRLTTLLLFHLVERCGGQVQFKLEDAQRVRTSLTTKMVQMQVGDEAQVCFHLSRALGNLRVVMDHPD
jgi:hypothetical protein